MVVHRKDDDDKKKKTIVIPMVKEVDWRVAKLLALEKEGKLTDEDRAKLAILTEEQPFASSNNSNGNDAIVVEEAEKVTEDADYSAVPIEDFGLAILRGCGWKDGEGIGRHPQVVPLRILPRRPNGLGLGAKPPQPESGAKVVFYDNIAVRGKYIYIYIYFRTVKVKIKLKKKSKRIP
ncbi:unnamed protein product [Strongylus vulgaris]|uniref:G-patch domain-containing protein n=1 Tax=Strongylus vulgaris TaxID=40348 RepID=A0A3P7M0J5_STRVU|nr:unnamed protein product [Strongylus vulgaris]